MKSMTFIALFSFLTKSMQKNAPAARFKREQEKCDIAVVRPHREDQRRRRGARQAPRGLRRPHRLGSPPPPPPWGRGGWG